MAEFKISRLRFTWKGQWATNKFYNRDAVTQFNGKTYICVTPHTSGDFYNDLNHTEQNGAPSPYWIIMLDGTAWKQAWLPNTYYSLGNIVQYGGVVYICKEHHTSGATQIDLSKWDTYSRFDNWNNDWATNHVYGIGDIVKYGGIVYRCTINHVSASSTFDGLEFDLSKWEIVNNGIDYKGNWSGATRYKKNDVVRVAADLYICTLGHTTSTNFSEINWSLWLPGNEYTTTWDQSIIYQVGDIVIYGGYTYVSKIAANGANIPSTSTAAWEVVTQGYRMDGEWAALTGPAPGTPVDYKIGDVVKRHGQLFVALADNTNEDPTAFSIPTTYTASGSSGTTVKVASTVGIRPGMIVSGSGFIQAQTVVSVVDNTTVTLNLAPDTALVDGQDLSFVGINYVYWDIVTPGINWTSFWQDDTEYVIGDLAVWKQGTYRCVSNHLSSPLLSPEQDLSATYWVPHALHDPRNALTNQGDLVTFNGTQNVPVSIGTEDYVLRAVGATPEWRKILTVPKVFYVASHGIDDDEHGDTLDKPWKTIKYAADKALNGSLFQNTKELLEANKDYIVEEVYQWMVYQSAQSNPPFNPLSVFDETASRRDAKLIIDALVYDISRGGNSQTVAATLLYFADGSTTSFKNDATDAAQDYIVASLEQLLLILEPVVTNVPSALGSFQSLNGIQSQNLVQQVNDPLITPDVGAYELLTELMNIPITAIANANTATVPQPNQGITSTIFVKTGTYSEELPIVIPENCALVGDELRGVVVQPLKSVYTSATSADAITGEITLHSVDGLEVGMPIQFASTSINDDFGSITPGQTYYIDTITTTGVTLTTALSNGLPVSVTSEAGFYNVYAGDCLKDMFYVRNGSGIRNMTLTGLAGTLTAVNQYLTRRPTGPSYVSLDPGTGPDDTRTWILKRSPYIQNVTNFGVGCTGLKIDGTLHNGGNKSIVCNDFTQILSDGVGIWTTGKDAVCEAISVFSYYGYTGYLAEDGGKIRAANGNSSYGTYGVIAEGYDASEVPISGNIDNQSLQVQASVQSAFGANAELLSMQFANSGSGYFETTTNLLKSSNDFLTTWTSDGNLNITQDLESPAGLANAWTIAGLTSGTDSSYLYQSISVQPPGAEYTQLAGLNISGSGVNATFNITVTSTEYLATVYDGGNNYVIDNEIRILGSQLGGLDGTNDCYLTVSRLSGSAITEVTVTGTVPAGSALGYTFSIYAEQGNSNSFDVYAIYSGGTSVTSGINFNFVNKTFTPLSENNGFLPVSYNKLELPNGWYRIWFTFNDITALNDTLQIRIYPRGKTGTAGHTHFYGAQLQIADSPTFYLETQSNTFTANANYYVTGAGTGAELVGDEIRTGSVFNTRVVDSNGGVGGAGYLTASNNAQGGNEFRVILAGSDTNTASNYIGMRVFINSGTGAGQYGYISDFDEINKYAQVLKESFTPLAITATQASDDSFTIDSSTDSRTLYVDQPVQFIPTYYTTTVTESSIDTITVTATTGGIINTLSVSSTAKLDINMPVMFTGNTFGGITTNYTYYIKSILSDTTIQLSTEIYGNVWFLNNATGIMTMSFPGYTSYMTGSTSNMKVNMPIQFTGTPVGGITNSTIYYINDIFSSNKFTISSTLVELTATSTNSTTSGITTGSVTGLVPLNPVVFSGVTIGGLLADTKYYVHKILNTSSFTVVDTIISITATATEETTNLVTVSSTAGFVANSPIVFTGNTFGNIVNEVVYYILAINDDRTCTISQSPGGSALSLTTATGSVLARTAGDPTPLNTDTGSMEVTSTTAKTTLTSTYGSMNGTFSTKLFGNVVQGTTYYVKTINLNSLTVSATPGGDTFQLKTDAGAMNIAECGWDHIIPGTPAEATLDSSSIYYVEAKATFDAPVFSQSVASTNNIAPETSWVDIAYGDGTFIAIANGNATCGKSTSGTSWTAFSLPEFATWSSVAYGNKYWVVISSAGSSPGSLVAYSNSAGLGWRTSNLPTVATWNNVVYGNGKFVATSAAGACAYSTNYGKTWTLGGSTGLASISSIAYGAGKFVAVSAAGTAAYSTDGNSWTVASPATASAWAAIAYGNNRFVTVSSTSANSAYSFDGITWYESNIPVTANKLAYGQGVFVALSSSSGTGYTSEDGGTWTRRTVTNDGYGAIAFGEITSLDYSGKFITVAGQNKASIINAGCQAKGRAVITSGKITSISQWEPGSGYTSIPTLRFTDPNITDLVSVSARISNGSLGNPTFINKGLGYNTNSTNVIINGGGYADVYQTGLTIIAKNLTRLPSPGDNLTISGDNTVYKVTTATAVFGTVAPNIQANIQIAPDMTIANSPDHNTALIIRTKYSQVRLTNHDFLNIGYGNIKDSNYPGVPTNTVLAPQDQAVETNFGRVFYTSTDQDGNFRVGGLFAVEQATGIVTLSASQFGLTGLETLSLGGIAVGGAGVVIRQFSTDTTFIANSNNVVPTQRAIKAYLTSRLSQGGSNTFTGQLTAGTVVVGGPDKIASTIPEGIEGSVVNIPVTVHVEGEFAGWAGDGAAMAFFMKTWNHR